MIPNMRVLTLHAFGETPEDDFRVTLSAISVKMIIAQDGVLQDRPIKQVTVLFMDDSEPVQLSLSEFDLLQLESVVGGYGYMEE